MKSLIFIAVLFAFNANALTCFTRTNDLQTTQVTLAKELCFAAPELELNYFEDSYALLRYSIDGERAFRKAVLKGKFNAQGNYVVNIVIENNNEGGSCDEYFEANSVLTLEVSKDGKVANITNLKGEVRYTYDICHDRPEVTQTIQYKKN